MKALLVVVAVTLVVAQLQCIDPYKEYGPSTMQFCSPPIFKHQTKNDTQPTFRLKDVETQIKYVTEVTPHINQARMMRFNESRVDLVCIMRSQN